MTDTLNSDSEAESGEEEGSNGKEDEDLDDLEESSEEDEEESKAETRPYMALIKSLTEDFDAPQAKRRKLDHQTASDEKPKDEPEPEKDVGEDVDYVEEAEEAPDEADAEGAFDDDQDDEEEVDNSDPFESHFSVIDEAALTRRLKAIVDAKWATKKVVSKGVRAVLNAPETGDKGDQISVPAPVSSLAELSLKHRLKEPQAGRKSNFNAVEQSLAPYIFGYRDLHFCNRSMNNGKSVRELACLHALNHVFKYVLTCPRMT